MHISALSYIADNYDKIFYIIRCLDVKKQRNSTLCLENNMYVMYFFELIVVKWKNRGNCEGRKSDEKRSGTEK